MDITKNEAVNIVREALERSLSDQEAVGEKSPLVTYEARTNIISIQTSPGEITMLVFSASGTVIYEHSNNSPHYGKSWQCNLNFSEVLALMGDYD